MGTHGTQGPSGQGKARLSSYDRLLNEDQKQREERLEIFIPNGPRLGNKVIEAHGLANRSARSTSSATSTSCFLPTAS